MKQLLLTMKMTLCVFSLCMGQSAVVRGTVVSQSDGETLAGVNVIVKGTTRGVVTDANGDFTLSCDRDDILVVSYIGYETQEIVINEETVLKIQLKESIATLSTVEIYSTGYEEIPPERATGSFNHVDQELVNRSTSTDIISRLENITPGLLFDKRLAGDFYGEDHRSVRIRGVNSIESNNSPLIVVDGFPYEGDLTNINPNDVENITILKDAAAASIWGARAANGVIVITTKSGNYEQPLSVSLTSNITYGEKPDLHYSPDYLPSSDYIEVERMLFERGFYNSDENSIRKPALSPVVELLIQERDGVITSSELEAELQQLRQQDVRDEAEKYFYRGSARQQYALNLRGGTEKSQYYLSGGYDKNLSSIDGNELQRITLVTNNKFRLSDKIEVDAGLTYINKNELRNGLSWGSVGTRYPYNILADESGNVLPVVNMFRQSYIEEHPGATDWAYRPLQEKALKDNTAGDTELRINTGIRYNLVEGLDINFKYQYQNISGETRNLQHENSYYVRNLVNTLTQANGESLFPEGHILTESFSKQEAHSARGQLNLNKGIGTMHFVSALAGMEVREVHATQSLHQVFGFDDDVLTFASSLDHATWYPALPSGYSKINAPSTAFGDITDRYLSYYGNASYTYNSKYSISASARWDASNLFGVKTNQKGVPLWSGGVSWDISEEGFYEIGAIPYLRIRATYGYNGNINKSVTAYPTGAYITDYDTDLPAVRVISPGNPQLRWEKIGVFNIGVDIESRNRRIYGQFEWYNKHGKDIIGESPFDPTTGFTNGVDVTNMINYAETRTIGMDIQLQTINIDRAIRWSSTILFSYAKNEVLEFYPEAITNNTIRSALSLNSSLLPQEGNSIDGLYSIPWYGLEPDTGDPLVIYEEQVGKDYRNYVRNLTLEDLIYHGPNVAPIFGALRNNISWKGLTLSANVSWKAGYYFRRSSISYDGLYNNSEGHRDYVLRWQEPGDEAITQVPSMPDSPDSYRDQVYNGSELLIEKGDHVRLEDVRFSYSTDRNTGKWMLIQNLELFLYAKNIGIIWRANELGLDPDYPEATYLQPRSISLGVNATF